MTKMMMTNTIIGGDRKLVEKQSYSAKLPRDMTAVGSAGNEGSISRNEKACPQGEGINSKGSSIQHTEVSLFSSSLFAVVITLFSI